MEERRGYRFRGAVQGVGFRPLLYRLARELGLSGFVVNTADGVELELQGCVDGFLERLQRELPPQAFLESVESRSLGLLEEEGFSIRESVGAAGSALILPDLAPCSDCLEEISDPGQRRYRYPFTNCTACGPRFSIIERLPYDRDKTSMKSFALCADCRREYYDPSDRRFHAQPIACPACGPQLQLLEEALVLLREGAIVALKGVGGFQLLVDAANAEAVAELRRRKGRSHKPFALMYPSLEAVLADCFVSDEERHLLQSQAAPIVLLRARGFCYEGVAPGNPYLGVMLPSSPLHHLLLKDFGAPIVATSGNRSGEAICTEVDESLRSLADVFLVHDRPIVHAVDDSVVQVVAGSKQVLRRARGYASLPIPLKRAVPPTLALGGQLKSTVALAWGKKLVLSQHLGDLETLKACEAFEQEVAELPRRYGVDVERVVVDSHPDYYSTKYAAQLGLPTFSCQHHLAHVYACMAEHQLEGPVLGLAWDGTGWGADGSIWGGECFLVEEGSAKRIASLRPFRLPGAERAIRRPALVAAALRYELHGQVDDPRLQQLLSSGFRAPLCSSMGRLFDGVAAILGLRQDCSFEGQAAMDLEFIAGSSHTGESYPFELRGDGVIDWQPLLEAMELGLAAGQSRKDMARRFHHCLVGIILAVAERTGLERVLLTGGVFQNRLLSELAIEALRKEGYQVFWPQEIPPNDGGIALGQVYALGVS